MAWRPKTPAKVQWANQKPKSNIWETPEVQQALRGLDYFNKIKGDIQRKQYNWQQQAFLSPHPAPPKEKGVAGFLHKFYQGVQQPVSTFVKGGYVNPTRMIAAKATGNEEAYKSAAGKQLEYTPRKLLGSALQTAALGVPIVGPAAKGATATKAAITGAKLAPSGAMFGAGLGIETGQKPSDILKSAGIGAGLTAVGGVGLSLGGTAGKSLLGRFGKKPIDVSPATIEAPKSIVTPVKTQGLPGGIGRSPAILPVESTEIGVTPFRGKPVTRVVDTLPYYETPRAKGFETHLQQTPVNYGIKLRNYGRSAGVWEGSIEPSYSVVTRGARESKLAYAAQLGKTGNQDAVIMFTPGTGNGVKHSFAVADADSAIAKMANHGISGGTIINNKLVIYDFDNSLKSGILSLSKDLGVKPKSTKGTVDLIERGNYDTYITSGGRGRVGDSTSADLQAPKPVVAQSRLPIGPRRTKSPDLEPFEDLLSPRPKTPRGEEGFIRIPGSKGRDKLPKGGGQPKPPSPSEAKGISQIIGPKSLSTKKVAQTSKSLQPESPLIPRGYRVRGFSQTIIDDPNVPPLVKESVRQLYKIRNSKQLDTKAANLVKDNPDLATQIARNGNDDVAVAISNRLIRKHIDEGNLELAIDTVNDIAPKLTKAGQTAQAAALYGRLTPEGILRFTQRQLNKHAEETGKVIKMTPDQAKRLTKMAKDIEKIPEGYERAKAAAKMMAEASKVLPPNLAQKLSTLQTIAMLLNPKTFVRNIGGNTILAGFENVSQTVATPVDWVTSLLTKKRTTTLPSLTTQARAGARGFKMGAKESWAGINLGPSTQFDLNNIPVFTGKILGNAEKAMGVALRGPDRAAYQAAFIDSLRGSMKLAKVTKPTQEMIEQATLTGLQRTFQDTNRISKLFVKVKEGLNEAGIGIKGKSFGMGDLILKFPRTPANLLSRGIEYSPAGFFKSLIEVAKPLTGRTFNQKTFVDAFSRAVVGSSGAFGMGYMLAKNGIITAQPASDADLRGLQKKSGLGGYQINASALKRWVLSGFDSEAAKLQKGDRLVTYDWAQPIAVPIAAGAALGANEPQRAGEQASNTLINAANTLVEQPLLQGVSRFFGKAKGESGITGAVQTALEAAPATFVPTALSQANQLTDNTQRQTYGVQSKVPIWSRGLQPAVDVMGENKERYQGGSNNFWNVLLNPSFGTTYQPNEQAEKVLDLYRRSGETMQIPRTAQKSVTIGEETIKLTPEQYTEYQRYLGSKSKEAIDYLFNNPTFRSMNDTDRADTLKTFYTDINSAAKIKLFGGQPKTKPVRYILEGSFKPVKAKQ